MSSSSTIHEPHMGDDDFHSSAVSGDPCRRQSSHKQKQQSVLFSGNPVVPLQDDYPAGRQTAGKCQASVSGLGTVVSATATEAEADSSGQEYASEVYELAKTPFGVSRYVLLVAYCLVTFMTGVCYWGWNGMQDMLYYSGAFTWRCTEGYVSSVEVGIYDIPTCPERRNAIGDLYTVAFACHFSVSALAGILLDVAGGKICGVVGLSFTGLGWILLALAGEASEGLYFAGMGFIGAGADTANLPLLSLGNLFPGNESFVLSVLGSVRSCSFAIPIILDKIYTSGSYAPDDFSKFCFGYVGVGVGLAMIIVLVLIPNRPFKVASRTDAQAAVPSEMEAAARGRRLSLYTGPGMPPVSTSRIDMIEMVDAMRGKSPDVAASQRRRASYTLNAHEGRRTSLMGVADAHTGEGSVAQRDGSYTVCVDSGEGEGQMVEYLSYVSNLKRPEFLLMLPFFCLCLIRAEFYSKSNKEVLVTSDGDNVYELFSIFNILSFIPGPILGRLCDKIGILWVVMILNVDGIFVYLFALFDNHSCKVISVLFFFVYTSFVLSNLYCYIADVFPTEHFGKLTGLASMVGGLFTLSSIGFYRMSTGDLGFTPAICIMISFGLLNIVLWWFMYSRQRKLTRPKADKSKADPSGAQKRMEKGGEGAHGGEGKKKKGDGDWLEV
eukprot:GHVQ01004987.1.p1 GENE.GHVQ01004987.1~~GHVQ01004987.1.p1  ORF type:complete len:665 (+),score=76.74 GHVQ01004987.1:972-2966(+)